MKKFKAHCVYDIACQDVVRNTWNFTGVIESDCGASIPVT